MLHTLVKAEPKFCLQLHVLLGAKNQVPVRETKCLSCFERDLRNMLNRIHVISDDYTKVLCHRSFSKVWLRRE